MHRTERPLRRALRLGLRSVLVPTLAALATSLQAGDAEPVDYQTSPKALSRSVSEIHAIAVAAGRPLLATAHANGLVIMRSAESGENLHVLAGHEGPVASLAFSPDGLRLVSGGYDGTVRVWKAESGEAEAVLTGHTSRVMAVTFAGNRIIASGGYDRTVRLCDVEQAREVATLDQKETVFSLDVSADGEHLAVGKADGSVAIWNLPERRLRTAIPAHKGPVRDLAFTPDGRSLITGGEDGFVGRWNMESQQQERAYSDSDPIPAYDGALTALAISPQGRTLATGDIDGRIDLWDVESGRHNGTLRGHEDLVSSLAFTSDAQSLLSGSYDRSLNLWRAKLPPEEPLAAISVPDASVWALRFTPGGDTLAVGGDGGSLALWDTASGKPVSSLTGFAETIDCVAFAPDGRRLAAAGWKSDTVGIWNLDDPDKPRLLSAEGPVRDLAFSRDGERLAAGLESKSAVFWNLSAAEQPVSLPEQKQPIYAVAFSPDARLLATGSGDWTVAQPGEVRLWDATNLAEVRTLGTHELAVRVVAFTPDGRHVVSAGEDGVIALWDREGRSEPRRLHNSIGTRAVAISADGHLIAAGLHDGTVNVWDVVTGEVVRRLSGADDFFALSFSSDGTLLAGGCGDKDVLLWNAVGRHEGLAASVAAWSRQRNEASNE